jgi:type I restriction enzyme S subunit
LATIEDFIDCDGVFSDGDWVESKDQDPNGDVRLIQLADVGDSVYRDRSSRYLTKAKAIELGCTFLKPGDVLIARMPDPLGRACIFPGDSKTSVTVVDICIVRTGAQGADHRWLMHAVNSPAFRQGIASLQSGSTRKRISRRNLARLELPLPPLLEQHRIVAEIEKQLTRLDAGVAALRRAKANLRRYKAAVLKTACEGRLVPQDPADEPASVLLERILAERRARWEAEQVARGKDPKKLKYQEPAAPDMEGLPELPEGWAWTYLDQLTCLITSGSRGWAKYYSDAGPLFIRAQDIKTDELYLNSVTNVDLPNAVEGSRTRVHQSDLLVTITGANVTKTALVKQQLDEAYVSQHVGLVRPTCEEISPYLYFWIVAPTRGRRQLEEYAYGMGKPGLNLTHLRELIIALPPLAEQQRIVAEVERRLSVAEGLEASIEANLKRAERLRQAVLKRAFAGELVPQDPDDEPASVLLERIRAGRERRGVEGNGKRKARRVREDDQDQGAAEQLRLL